VVASHTGTYYLCCRICSERNYSEK